MSNTNSIPISKIFDLTLKCALDLSPIAVINFINGLYGESLSLENEVIRTSTESVSSDLTGHTFSDKMLTIRSKETSRRFHIESEISSRDNEIVLRIFDYGYQDALKHRAGKKGNLTLNFPQPKIIYLEHSPNAPDEVTLEINFWGQQRINFTVLTMKLLNHSVKDLDERRMTILLPLYLLKLRSKVKNAKTKQALQECAAELKQLLNEEILESIAKNVAEHNLTPRDAHTLMKLLSTMYNHLYGAVEEFKDERVNVVLEEKIWLPNEREVLAAREEARQEGREEGKEEGREETAITIALNLLTKGLSPEVIADATRLPLERVLTLNTEAYAV